MVLKQRYVIIAVVVTLLVILIIGLLKFSSIFKPQKEIIKQTENTLEIIKWEKNIGILDQTFPDNLIVVKDDKVDTICSAYNIEDYEIIKIIKIKFNGTPNISGNKNFIPTSVYDYKIIIDTVK